MRPLECVRQTITVFITTRNRRAGIGARNSRSSIGSCAAVLVAMTSMCSCSCTSSYVAVFALLGRLAVQSRLHSLVAAIPIGSGGSAAHAYVRALPRGR